MDVNKAMSIFKKSFSKLIITRCIDYDKEHFVIEAVEDISTPNYNDPYYAVNKHTSEITSFIPAIDIDAFFDAIEKRTIYSIDK